MKRANQQGLGYEEPQEFAGQGEVVAPGKSAESYLRALGPRDEDVALLDNIKLLTWHEELNAGIRKKMGAQVAKIPTVCFDFSGVQLKSTRGDAAEFYRPAKLSVFGMMITTPRKKGAYARTYVDVFAFSRDHTSSAAAASLKCGLERAVEEAAFPRKPENASFYSDKGKHFCSGELAWGILFQISEGWPRVPYNYHACYHGKTPLDSHFGRVKQKINGIAVEKWPKDKHGVEALVLAEVGTLENTLCVFLEDTYFSDVRKKLVIPDISCVQELTRIAGPDEAEGALLVEGIQFL